MSEAGDPIRHDPTREGGAAPPEPARCACGYELDGLVEKGGRVRCPECGRMQGVDGSPRPSRFFAVAPYLLAPQLLFYSWVFAIMIEKVFDGKDWGYLWLYEGVASIAFVLGAVHLVTLVWAIERRRTGTQPKRPGPFVWWFCMITLGPLCVVGAYIISALR